MNRTSKHLNLKMTVLAALAACTVLASSMTAAADGSNSDIIYSFLTEDIGLNSAAACGVLGNIYQECKMDPTASGGSFYGLCQWGGSRRSGLYSYCEENGLDPASLTGQLHYLQYELENIYTGTLSELGDVSNTADGAASAAAIFCTNFEQPGNLDWENSTRGSYAVDIFWASYVE